MATIGSEFTFEVFSRRWGHKDTYTITLLKNGWHVRYVAIAGDCDPTGEPFLFKNLRHDSIQYPRGLGDAFEWLFNEHADLSDGELQEAIQRLADWVSASEQATPIDGTFGGVF